MVLRAFEQKSYEAILSIRDTPQIAGKVMEIGVVNVNVPVEEKSFEN